MATDAMRACSGSIDPARLEDNFEVFGIDFRPRSLAHRDQHQPCLELSCPLLGAIIPRWSKTPSSTLPFTQTDARSLDSASSKILVEGDALLLQGLGEGEQVLTGDRRARGEALRQFLTCPGPKTVGRGG